MSSPPAKPPEGTRPILPEAIYLDANALFQLPETQGDDHPYTAFRGLAEQWHAQIYAPELAVCEWKQRKQAELKVSARQLMSAWTRLSRYVPLGATPDVDTGALPDRVSQALDEQMRKLGIATIETPRNVELTEIIDMAVRKVRPFEERGEKGFRDTLILMALVAHMRTAGLTNALLVSGDDVFDHQDVAARLHRHGFTVVRANDFADAVARIKEAGEYAALAAMTDWSRRIVEFANSRLNDIWEHIRNSVSVPARHWLHSDLDEPTILHVFDARPLRVSSAMPTLSPGPERAGFEFASIGIDVELDVLARYTTRAIVLNRTEFSLSAEREFEPIEHRGHGQEERTTTLTRRVLVDVEIKVDDGTFVDIAVQDSQEPK